MYGGGILYERWMDNRLTVIYMVILISINVPGPSNFENMTTKYGDISFTRNSTGNHTDMLSANECLSAKSGVARVI